MTEAASRPLSDPRRPSRFWLFAPYVVLLGLAAAWSAAWFVTRDRTVEGFDAWVGRERAEGRAWHCPDRSVAGFPFRIEVVCPNLSLTGPGLALGLGRVGAVSQVYQPRHVIAEAAGPLRLEAGGVTVEGTWRLLQASVKTAHDVLERLSLAIDTPEFRVAGLRPEPVAVAARRLEAHLRPGAEAGEPRPVYDANLRVEGAAIPNGTALGITEPADIELVAKVAGAADLGAPLADTVEAWRRAGGRIEVGRLRFAAGQTRLEAAGSLTLDDLHRPAGRLDGSGAGLQDLLRSLVGPTGALVGGLLGSLAGAPRQGPSGAGRRPPDLKPLPSVRLEGGRVFVGPLPVPNLRLAPLY